MAGGLNLVVCGERGVATLPLRWERDELVLGRGADCNIHLSGGNVSSEHARLTRDPASGAFWLTDLGGGKGDTTLDGRRLEPGRPVPFGRESVARLGDLTLMLAEARAPWRRRHALSAEAFARRVEAEAARASAEGSTFALVEGRVGTCRMNREAPRGGVARMVLERSFCHDDAVLLLGDETFRVLVPRASPDGVRPLLARWQALADGLWFRLSARWAFFPGDGVTGASLALALDDVIKGPIEVRGPPPPVRLTKCLPLVERLGASDENVVIEGEAGTAEEELARLVHARSPRAGRPFVRVDCGALTDENFARLFYGHERGPSAGPGLFETVEDGTLFFDEIADTPLSVQAELARVLASREFSRVGGLEARPVRARFVFTTRHGFRMDVAMQHLSRELRARIVASSVRVGTCPVHENKGAIAPYVETLLAGARDEAGRPLVVRLSPRARAVLEAYHWPGNMRELCAVVEIALRRCRGLELTPDHLPLEHFYEITRAPAWSWCECRPPRLHKRDGGESSEAESRELVAEALEKSSGNIDVVAAMLGVTRATAEAFIEAFRPRVPPDAGAGEALLPRASR